MKKLRVPYLPALDGTDLPSAGALLEDGGQREYIDTVNWSDDFPYKPIASFDIARSDRELYIRFFVRGKSLKAIYEADGSPVHQDSCVEFFMQRPEEEVYRNFEFNCTGVCDAAVRLSRQEKTSLTKAEYASIRRQTSLAHKPFGEIKGVHAWELIVAIPFEAMDLNPARLPERIRGNFYHCADGVETPRYLSWNPIDTPSPDFHRPDFFGEIFF